MTTKYQATDVRHRAGHGGNDADHDRSTCYAAHRIDLKHGAPHFGVYHFGVPKQRVAKGSWDDPPRLAIEQNYAKFRLQAAYRLAEGRLRDTHGIRSRVHRFVLHAGDKVAQ